ncbi:ABC transporter permease [Dyadobacter sp. LHD-138]|uniref:ABC transporter permease n=1 Tax=Dyadobacter sp. LHD-138 TaxID=3071413 RepID=UPI0027E0200F|nr:ABC transporter permease [Dyadobacter sp. LHD-138]MDQ6478299.1 FtsX-like permease family protein [Dyadobacter sp. LHD-138]
MFKNYLRIALRNLWKHKNYSFINIAGLAMGMAVSMLILMFVVHEYSYDKFHEKGNRIYRLLTKVKMDGHDMQSISFSAKLAPLLKESTPHVEDFVRVKAAYNKVVIKNPERPASQFFEKDFLFADGSFFNVFSFKVKSGDRSNFLAKPYTMVISERAAAKYFGDQDPVGKTLLYEGKHLFEITGVAENPPSNSTFNFDFVASVNTIPQLDESNKSMWEHAGAFNNYYLLDSEKSVALVQKNILSAGKKTGAFDEHSTYILEKFSSIHLENSFASSGNVRLIKIFAGVASLILFLALFNYMNLTTARSTLRAKEVGVRKVAGAGRGGLIKQFYTESVLVCCLAFLLSFVLVEAMRRPFYNLLDLRIDSSFLLSPAFIGILVSVLLLSAFVAGSYPALILSGFAPIEVLKGRFTSQQKGVSLRRIFMVFQFSVSIALIVCSVIVQQQLSYMQNKNLGFNKDQMLAISLSGSVGKNYFSLKNEIASLTGVEDVAISSTGLFKGYSMSFSQNPDTKKFISLTYSEVDANFPGAFGLAWKIKPDGSSWKKGDGVLLNEVAVKELGLKGNPIGQQVFNRRIAGVLKNFQFTSVQHEVKAMGLFVLSDTTNLLKDEQGSAVLFARMDPKIDIKDKIASIEKIYKKYSADKPFEYYFLDDAFNETFKTEIRMSRMFTVFTAFAIFIACMGLFGLVTFTAETRTKEIGIRKVLGASVSSVVTLLSKDFFKLVFIAIIMATPVAWYAMDKWLQDFAYKIEIAWWVFAAAGLVTMVITFLTVGFQSFKAALMDPVKSLKTD